MCGRFTLRTPAKVVAEVFGLPEVPELRPRYNIAPTDPVAAVRRLRGSGGGSGTGVPPVSGRELVCLRWGLIPFWAEDPKIGNRMINARAETVATAPAFRRSFESRRCLVVADGFYEWQRRSGQGRPKGGGRKQPFYVRMRDGRPFAFAGLWDRWRRGGDVIESCTILTTDSNELVRPIHDRMPVIVPPDGYGAWLDPETPRERLEGLLAPYGSEAMVAYPVGTLVNDPKNDVEECVRALEG